MQMVIEEVRNKRADTALKLAQGDAQKATALLKETEASFIDDEVLVKQLGVTVDIKTAKMQDRQVELSSDKLDLERDKLDQQKKEFKAGD
jgi:subtilisin-like proprotein convertase family protein